MSMPAPGHGMKKRQAGRPSFVASRPSLVCDADGARQPQKIISRYYSIGQHTDTDDTLRACSLLPRLFSLRSILDVVTPRDEY